MSDLRKLAEEVTGNLWGYIPVPGEAEVTDFQEYADIVEEGLRKAVEAQRRRVEELEEDRRGRDRFIDQQADKIEALERALNPSPDRLRELVRECRQNYYPDFIGCAFKRQRAAALGEKES